MINVRHLDTGYNVFTLSQLSNITDENVCKCTISMSTFQSKLNSMYSVMNRQLSYRKAPPDFHKLFKMLSFLKQLEFYFDLKQIFCEPFNKQLNQKNENFQFEVTSKSFLYSVTKE